MGYFKKTAIGISWVGASRGITRSISFLKSVIIARILTPYEFGLYGIALLVLAFLEILTETGINVFLIQEKKDIDDYIDAAWVVSIVRGVLISSLICLSSFAIVKFFKSSEAFELIIFISLVPLIRGFINPSSIKLEKELRFKSDFVYRSVLFLFDALVAVTLTVITGKAIGLVIGNIAGVTLEMVSSNLIFKPRPKFKFNIKKLRRIISRGKWLTGAGIFQYLFRQGDDIVVGRMLDSSALGLYQMAYRIATLPISEVADVFGKVTLPIFARMSYDFKKLKKAHLMTTLGVSLLTIPFGLVLVLFPKEILNFTLGEKWVGASNALALTAVYAVIRATMNPTLTLFLAAKKQEYFTAVTLIGILGMGISIVPLVLMYGIVGASLSTIIGSLLSVPFVIYFFLRLMRTGS